MPKLGHRNKKKRKVKKKTPGARGRETYLERKPAKAKCGNCGAELHGTPNNKNWERKQGPKSEKRPERPYGGNLCSSCMREKIKQEVIE